MGLLKAKRTVKADEPTAAMIKKFKRLDAKRLELNRKARTLSTEVAKLYEEMFPFVAKKMKDRVDKTFVFQGYRFTMKSSQKQVSWSAEYIKQNGEEAATALRNAQPEIEYYEVESAT